MAAVGYELPSSRFWVGMPHPKQERALAMFGTKLVSRMLYGGAAGGGKTELAIMLALQYVDYPGWNVLILAKSIGQHERNILGRLKSRLAADIRAGRVSYKNYTFTFAASRATIECGIIRAGETAEARYAGSEYTCIIVDEAGHFNDIDLKYLPARLGRTNPPDPNMPNNCYLLTANPTGPAFLHLYETYYASAQTPTSYYLPARIADNPTLPPDYADQFDILPPAQRDALLNGDWTAVGAGVLWTPDTIMSARLNKTPDKWLMEDVVIGVDPAASAASSSSEWGIVVAGRHSDTGQIIVLEDHSANMQVESAMAIISQLAEDWLTHRIVFERNMGGLIGPALLRNVGEHGLFIHSVHTHRGKYERAMPVGLLYSSGQVAHAPGLDTLERHMASFTPESVKRADRIDAMVYAIMDVDGDLGKLGSVEVIE